jgi:hypothetical protein
VAFGCFDSYKIDYIQMIVCESSIVQIYGTKKAGQLSACMVIATAKHPLMRSGESAPPERGFLL